MVLVLMNWNKIFLHELWIVCNAFVRKLHFSLCIGKDKITCVWSKEKKVQQNSALTSGFKEGICKHLVATLFTFDVSCWASNLNVKTRSRQLSEVQNNLCSCCDERIKCGTHALSRGSLTAGKWQKMC